MAAAGMNHEIECPFFVLVYFNEMIAAAKCSDAALCLCLLDYLVAAQSERHATS